MTLDDTQPHKQPTQRNLSPSTDVLGRFLELIRQVIAPKACRELIPVVPLVGRDTDRQAYQAWGLLDFTTRLLVPQVLDSHDAYEPRLRGWNARFRGCDPVEDAESGLRVVPYYDELLERAMSRKGGAFPSGRLARVARLSLVGIGVAARTDDRPLYHVGEAAATACWYGALASTHYFFGYKAIGIERFWEALLPGLLATVDRLR